MQTTNREIIWGADDVYYKIFKLCAKNACLANLSLRNAKKFWTRVLQIFERKALLSI